MNIPVKIDFENFNLIITELKKIRKGAAMIVFLYCLAFIYAVVFFKQRGFIFDWFSNLCLCIAFISINIWTIKLFNSICEKKELKEREKQKEIEFKAHITALLKEMTPFFKTLTEDEVFLLKKFVKEDSPGIYVNPVFLDAVCTINQKTYSRGGIINCTGDFPVCYIYIPPDILEVLKLYFA